MKSTEDMIRRSDLYARERSLRLDGRLGFGKDGVVWRTHRASAVKVFWRDDLFRREQSVYQRLSDRGALDVCGHAVPQLIAADPRTWVIEMTIVQPPFVLDFASAYLDGTAPTFPADVMAEWLAEKQEEFGERWPRVRTVLAGLRSHGVQTTDVHPGNIAFAENV